MQRKRWVCLAVLGYCAAFAQSPQSTECLEMDIAVLADMSGSVTNFSQFIWDAASVIPERYELGENKVRLSLIRFNSDATLLTPLTGDRKAYLGKIAQTRTLLPSGSTNIDRALTLAKSEFDASPRRVLRAIILISDGDSTDGRGREFERSIADAFKAGGGLVIAVQTPPPTLTPALSPADLDWDGMDWDAKPPRPRSNFMPSTGTTPEEWESWKEHMRALSSPGLFFEEDYETLSELMRELIIPCI